MSTRAIEDYLKTIYELQEQHGLATTTVVADHLAIAPASVTGMMKKLATQGLVVHTPYHGVELTTEGETLALQLVRRHRLVECLLCEIVGLPWESVHQEAEQLEHAVSPELEQRLDALLGHPTTDPHGAPIPPRNGAMPQASRCSLGTVSPGQSAVVAEVSDHDAGLLRYIGQVQLYPGTTIRVLDAAPIGDTLTIEVNGQEHILGQGITRHILVTDIRPIAALQEDHSHV